jgi:hypothetical protein
MLLSQREAVHTFNINLNNIPRAFSDFQIFQPKMFMHFFALSEEVDYSDLLH